MFDISIQHQKTEFEIISNIAVEYLPKKNTHYLSTSNPQDFLLDLREFYLAWYSDFGELRLGKQIHTWGSVDENSPIDIVNAYDYYYLFFNGKYRKLGSFSASIDFYYNNWKLGGVISPFHHTNRIPLDDPNFPIKLPIIPQEFEIYPIEKNPLEYGVFIEYSHNYGDIRLSTFHGYDRIFNLTGINDFTQNEGSSGHKVYILYGYRKTRMIGLGATVLLGDLVMRGDYALFKTKDKNKSVYRDNPDPVLGNIYNYLSYQYAFSEEANYYQMTLQFEYGLPYDILMIGQFFSYDILDYTSNDFPIDEDIDIPNLELSASDFNAKSFFSPGMGTPAAALTKKSISLNLEKQFFDNQLKIAILSMADIFNPSTYNNGLKIWGYIFGLNIVYDITQDLNILTGITQIYGNNAHPLSEEYRFNQMEYFSHIRLELSYSF